MELAVDTDHTVRSLFDPLVRQLAHYFCRRSVLSTETSLLLDVVVSAATATFPSASFSFQTAFGSDILCELFRWSIKLTPEEDLVQRKQNNAVNIMIQRISALARHPDPRHRLAAVTAAYQSRREFVTCTPAVNEYVLGTEQKERRRRNTVA